MKIDLSKDGLESAFQPWEVKTIEILLEGGEQTSGTLLARLNSGDKIISQASIINLLEELTAFGITRKRVTTGKGGWRGVYEFNHTEQSLREYLASLAENWTKNMRKQT